MSVTPTTWRKPGSPSSTRAPTAGSGALVPAGNYTSAPTRSMGGPALTESRFARSSQPSTTRTATKSNMTSTGTIIGSARTSLSLQAHSPSADPTKRPLNENLDLRKAGRMIDDHPTRLLLLPRRDDRRLAPSLSDDVTENQRCPSDETGGAQTRGHWCAHSQAPA